MSALPVPIRAFRNARWYASPRVTERLTDLVEVRSLALVVDVDALECTTLVRIDRVMQLALAALVDANVGVVFTATVERWRAAQLHRSIRGTRFVPDPAQVRRRVSEACAIVISDDPALLATLSVTDRVISAADSAIRATLWWLLEQRLRTAPAV